MDQSFRSCENLGSITIPNSVEEIYHCFTNSNATSIRFEGKFDKLKKIVHSFKEFKSDSEIIIPNGVEVLSWCFRSSPFTKCNITKVTLPNSLIEITESFTGSQIDELVILTPTPPQVKYSSWDKLKDLFHYCTLIVPKGSLDAYKKAACFENFENIKELE